MMTSSSAPARPSRDHGAPAAEEIGGNLSHVNDRIIHMSICKMDALMEQSSLWKSVLLQNMLAGRLREREVGVPVSCVRVAEGRALIEKLAEASENTHGVATRVPETADAADAAAAPDCLLPEMPLSMCDATALVVVTDPVDAGPDIVVDDDDESAPGPVSTARAAGAAGADGPEPAAVPSCTDCDASAQRARSKTAAAATAAAPAAPEKRRTPWPRMQPTECDSRPAKRCRLGGSHPLRNA